MRLLPLIAALSLATPAAAQLQPAPNTPQYAELLAQQEAVRQQLIQQHNDLMALEAQMRTEQTLRTIEAQGQSPRLPPVAFTGRGPYPHIDTGQLATIPDAALAESNRRVLEAAGPPR